MPKNLDTTITDISIHNLMRPSVLATTIVPRDGISQLTEQCSKGEQVGMVPGNFELGVLWSCSTSRGNRFVFDGSQYQYCQAEMGT